MILYCPELSVITDRTLSINAGLEASTVTPGSTAPDVSLTTPPMALVCADATAGSRASSATPQTMRANVRMLSLLLEKRCARPIGRVAQCTCRADTLLPSPSDFWPDFESTP